MYPLTFPLTERSESGQSGTATLFDRGLDTEVVIETQGGTDNGRQLAHLRTGACAADGGIAGYVVENLNALNNGQSSTLVEDRRVVDLQGGRYHVAVQNSGDPSRAQVCGEIP